MITNIIRTAFDLYAGKKNVNGVLCLNWASIKNHVEGLMYDRRFKLFLLAGDTNGRSAIVKYAGSKYYVAYNWTKKLYEIERA